jgi:hypothetical protein
MLQTATEEVLKSRNGESATVIFELSCFSVPCEGGGCVVFFVLFAVREETA